MFAEGQAVRRRRRDHRPTPGRRATAAYDGRGICYLEFGDDLVARVDVTFRSGQAPSGQFDDPSALLAADKAQFGSSRIRRWFGRDWAAF